MIKNIFEMLLEEREVKRRRLDGSKGVGSQASMNMPINSVDEVKAWDEYVKEKVRATAHMF
jgi:hypothetical protein